MKYVLLLIFSLFLITGTGQAQTYVGPEKCLQCHNNSILGDATGWRSSLHANGYSVVLDDAHSMENLYGIIADYDQNGIDDFKDGLDFNTISSVFDPYKPNAPVLGYNPTDGYTITIGQVTHKVYLTYGGSGLYKQRFGVRINTSEGESDAIYISPIQFNEKTYEYVLYHPDAWYDGSNQPIFTPSSTLADAATNSRNLSKGCSGCHVTGLELTQSAAGEWIAHGASVDPATESMYLDPNIFDIDNDGDLDQINIGCERCHGPGGDHATTPTAANIINPETDLTIDQANNLCGMCHSRGHSLPNGTFSFPFDDNNMLSWTVGDLVADFYSDGGGYWGDGIQSKKHHQQFYDFYKSSKPVSQFEPVGCFSCHDVHNTSEHHIRTEIAEEDSLGAPITIATNNDDNSLCLSCHATHGHFSDIPKEWVANYSTYESEIAAVVTNHTRHSWDPTDQNGTNGASRCSKCHNPKMAKSAIAYDIHSHTFDPVSPEKTIEFDMPNACAVSCHNKNGYNFGVDMSGDVFTDWSEQSDKDLAHELLFWYENMFFDETNESGNNVDAVYTTNAPTIDGDDTDAAWSGVNFVTIPLGFGNSVDVKSVYTDTDLYMLFRWADSTASFTRSAWEFDGAAWSTVSGNSEDRLALMWNMSVPEADWNDRGCLNKCHRNVDNTNAGQDSTTSEDDAYLPPGQKADMWHMKAARSLPTISASGTGLTVDPVSHQVTAGTVQMVGYIDDKYIGPFDAGNAPDGGRYGDAGSSTYARNRNAAKTAPKYIETNPTDFMDAMVLRQSEIDGGETVMVDSTSNTDLQTYWANYAALNAAVPERVLRDPVDSRGDVMQGAKWENGFWVTEIKRALDTGHSADDAAFAPNNKYTFGIALMDNTGGDGHQTSGRATASLNIGISGINNGDATPHNYALSQNYPNPFNPTTTIDFSLAKAGKVVVDVYSITGQKITTLVNGFRNAGSFKVKFDGSNLASGMYLVRMTSGEFNATRKMVLIK